MCNFIHNFFLHFVLDIKSHIVETRRELKTNISNAAQKWETTVNALYFVKSPLSPLIGK